MDEKHVPSIVNGEKLECPHCKVPFFVDYIPPQTNSTPNGRLMILNIDTTKVSYNDNSTKMEMYALVGPIINPNVILNEIQKYHIEVDERTDVSLLDISINQYGEWVKFSDLKKIIESIINGD